MRRSDEQTGREMAGTRPRTRWVMLAATVLVTTTEMFAQEKWARPAQNLIGASHQPLRGIIVSIPDRKLALVENGRVVKVYPVAVGAPASPSPSGQFRIVQRVANPTYYAPGYPRRVIPPGKANPVGARWIGLNQEGYGIHGTNEPRSVGRRVSHGCIRMRNRDVEELFDRVRVGDVVELHGERSAELARIFGGPVPALPAALPANAQAPSGTQPAPAAVAVAVAN